MKVVTKHTCRLITPLAQAEGGREEGREGGEGRRGGEGGGEGGRGEGEGREGVREDRGNFQHT